MLNNIKKGQALPLNTIVIAILVVIVLLVIVVFFTTNVGRTGNQIGEVAGCNDNNAALTTVGWSQMAQVNEVASDALDTSCAAGKERIKLVPSVKNDDDTYNICCGVPKE